MATRSDKARASVRAELGKQAQQYAQLMRLHRPIGIWLLMWPTLWGLWIARDGRPDPVVFIVFVLGVIVMRSAGCVINDLADRKFDVDVMRTKDRPLATGNISPIEALVLFVALGLIAIALALLLNPLTQMLAVVAALLTVIYPFTKRFFSAPQLILGAAFGWSIPMAFAAQTGAVSRLAWLMWLTVFIWAIIYDTMYAMADREEDLRIGVRSTAILFGNTDLFMVTTLQVIMLLALLLIGAAAKLGGWYLAGVGVAVVLMAYQRFLIRNRQREHCLRAFLNNQYVGAAVFCGIVLDYTFN